MNKQLLIALSAIALLAVGASLFLSKTHHKETVNTINNDNTVEQWKLFKKTYHKKFADPEYEEYRFNVFSQNLKIVEQNPANFGITQFMDLTSQEFAETYLTLQAQNDDSTVVVEPTAAPTTSIDWVAKGIVTPVKNQGQCGSCWSFSTTGAVESFLNIPNGNNNISLSEQYLVDCSKNGNNGCNGGLMDAAMTYIQKNKITTETAYPYVGKDGSCQSISNKPQYSIKTHSNVKKGDCNGLYEALSMVPVAVAVDASKFQFYSTGILSVCDKQLNHGVLLTGYTAATSSSQAYWVIKNSWGTGWGLKGYIHLAYGDTCGVCDMASYVVS